MTLSDIKVELYRFFQTNDQLILPDDKLKVLIISETPELHYAALFEALKTYEDSGLVKRVEFKDGKNSKTGFILDKPIQSYQQTITISGDLAWYISKVLNQLNTAGNNVSNPLLISNLEIEALTVIAEQFIVSKSEIKDEE